MDLLARQRAALGLSLLMLPVAIAGGASSAAADDATMHDELATVEETVLANPVDEREVSQSDMPDSGVLMAAHGEDGGARGAGEDAVSEDFEGDEPVFEPVVSAEAPELPVLGGSDIQPLEDAAAVPRASWHATVDLSAESVLPGGTVTLTPAVSGVSAEGFTYNYVWNYEGRWAEWGSTVLEQGGPTSEASWEFRPAKKGRYQLFVDATDPWGKTQTVELWVTVETPDWSAAATASASKVVTGTAVTLTPAVSGVSAEGFTYNYVWNYEGRWAEWGSTVLEQGGPTSEASWEFRPAKKGRYQLFVDATDPWGKTQTVELWVTVEDWVASLGFSATTVPVGSAITVTPRVDSANPSGFTYNYVWNYEGRWAEWGSTVLEQGGPTSEASWEFRPAKKGRYQLFVDVTDAKGNTRTFEQWVTVTEDWELSSVEVGDAVVGQPVAITAVVSGNLSRLSYKFVWEKDNWAQSGVIKNASSQSAVTWTPQVSGNVNLHVYVIDSSGDELERVVPVSIRSESVDFTSVDVEADSEGGLELGDTLRITPRFEASDDRFLQFRYSWSRSTDGKTAVIQDWSSKPSATWKLESTGNVTITVEMRDSSGRITSKTASVWAEPETWSCSGLASPTRSVHLGSPIKLNALVEGETDNLTYHYVWQKNNWAQWGVIVKTSKGYPSVSWTPTEPGDYTLYCDVSGSDGTLINYSCNVSVWDLKGVDVTWLGGDNWKIVPDLGIAHPESAGLSFNYVWNKDGAWQQWGSTVKDTGGYTQQAEWRFTPPSQGSYDLTVDVIGPDGSFATGSSSVVRYDDYRYSMWQRVQNYTSLTPYLIACDLNQCVVGVYHNVNGHWEQIQRWSCSPGAWSTPTVTGLFTVGEKGYYFDSFGSRCFYYTQFYGDYLFHSTLYYPGGGVMDNRLGMHLSHGCVRLAINNAKWIYDNVPYGSTVLVY